MQDTSVRAIDWTEQGLVPDLDIRHGIRRLLRNRLAGLETEDCGAMAARKARFIREMDQAPVAPLPQRANEQHYAFPGVACHASQHSAIALPA